MTAFSDLMTILAAAKRPLAFFDFETASVDGNPCEFAIAILDPQSHGAVEPSEDLDKVMAGLRSPDVPMGLPGSYGAAVAFAISARLNPGQPISPGASAIHGIFDEDVASEPRFDDDGLVEFWNEIEERNPIWCGHNIAGFDLPLAKRCGYLRREHHDIIDTLRMARRIQEDEPYPPALDPSTMYPVPAAAGIHVFKSSLSALHVALCDWSFEGAHGALSDVTATIRVFGRMLDLWFSKTVAGDSDPIGLLAQRCTSPSGDPSACLRIIIDMLNRPPSNVTGHDGWLRRINLVRPRTNPLLEAGLDDSQRWGYEFTRGKFANRMLVKGMDRRYFDDFLLKLPDLDESTRKVLEAHR